MNTNLITARPEMAQIMTRSVPEAVAAARELGCTVEWVTSLDHKSGVADSVIAVKVCGRIADIYQLTSTNKESVLRGAIRSYWWTWIGHAK